MFKNCWLNEQWMVNTTAQGNLLCFMLDVCYTSGGTAALAVVWSHVWYLVEWDSDSQWLSTPKQTPLLTLSIIIVIWIFMTSFQSFSHCRSYATEISLRVCAVVGPLEARDFPTLPALNHFVFLSVQLDPGIGVKTMILWTILLSRSPIITLKVKGWKC